MKLVVPDPISWPFLVEVSHHDVIVTYKHGHLQGAHGEQQYVKPSTVVMFGSWGVEMTPEEAELLGVKLIKGAL